MAFGEGPRAIWLDGFIGVRGEYLRFKEQFNSSMRPMTSMPPNNINELIHFFETDVCPIIFVDNADDALNYILDNRKKTLIWISSASAGKPIMPTIVRQYQHVQRYYMFCQRIRDHVDWALEREYETILQLFDHEMDFLIRLMRDTSSDIIDLGKTYLQLRDGENARKCFVTSRTLEIGANESNRPRAPFRERLALLEGPSGLIAQAQEMRDGNR